MGLVHTVDIGNIQRNTISKPLNSVLEKLFGCIWVKFTHGLAGKWDLVILNHLRKSDENLKVARLIEVLRG